MSPNATFHAILNRLIEDINKVIDWQLDLTWTIRNWLFWVKNGQPSSG